MKSYFLYSRTQTRKTNLADLLFLNILALPLLLGHPINSNTVFQFTQAQNLKGISETSSCIHHPIICQVPLTLLQYITDFGAGKDLSDHIKSALLLYRGENWGLESRVIQLWNYMAKLGFIYLTLLFLLPSIYLCSCLCKRLITDLSPY